MEWLGSGRCLPGQGAEDGGRNRPGNRAVSARVSTTELAFERPPNPIAMNSPLPGFSAILLTGFALLATGCVSEYYETTSAPPYSGTTLPAASRVAIVMEFRGGEPSPQERAEVRALLAEYLAGKGSVLVDQPSDADYLVHAILERRNPDNPAEWTVVNTYSAQSLSAVGGDDYRWPGGIIEDDFYETTRFTYIGFGVFYPIWFDTWDSPWHRGRVRVCPPPRRHDHYRDSHWREERRWHRPDRWQGPHRRDSDHDDRPRPGLRPGDRREDDRRRPDAPNRPTNRPNGDHRSEDRRDRDRINDGDRRPGGDRNSGDGRGNDRDHGGVNRRPGSDVRPPAPAQDTPPAVRPSRPNPPLNPPPAVNQPEPRPRTVVPGHGPVPSRPPERRLPDGRETPREHVRERTPRPANHAEPPLANPRPSVERPRTPPSQPPERPRAVVGPDHGTNPPRPTMQPPAEPPKVQPPPRVAPQRPVPEPRREPTQRPEVRRSEAPRHVPPPPRREAPDNSSRDDHRQRSRDRSDDNDKNRDDSR